MPIPVKHEIQKRQSAKMRIYYTLREWITYGTLQPGERLNDQEISDYFEVSRTPVREALQMLEAQKLIVICPNKATYVSEIETDNLEKWYLPMAHLHALAAQLACRSITAQQIAELRKIDRQILEYIQQGNIIDTLQEDLVLHDRILAIADNEFITQFSEILMLHIQRIEYAFFKRSGLTTESFTSHAALLDAMERGDGTKAFDEMLHNWLTILDHSSELIGTALSAAASDRPAAGQRLP